MAFFFCSKRSFRCFNKFNLFMHFMETKFVKPFAEPHFKRRINKILEEKLLNITPEELDVLLTDLISFVGKSGSARFQRLKKEFVDICVNAISYWIFEGKDDPELVRLLLQKTRHYMKDKSSPLAFAYRPFKEQFGSPSWAEGTPLQSTALSKKVEAFRLLLQYGVLEEENNPLGILTRILTHPSMDRLRPDGSVIQVSDEAEICLQLCARVLPSMPVSQLEAIMRSAVPTVLNWRDYILPASSRIPYKLAHLCMLQIRKQLLQTEHLPEGISDLEIPNPLKGYINLLY